MRLRTQANFKICIPLIAGQIGLLFNDSIELDQAQRPRLWKSLPNYVSARIQFTVLLSKGLQ